VVYAQFHTSLFLIFFILLGWTPNALANVISLDCTINGKTDQYIIEGNEIKLIYNKYISQSFRIINENTYIGEYIFAALTGSDDDNSLMAKTILYDNKTRTIKVDYIFINKPPAEYYGNCKPFSNNVKLLSEER